MKKYFNCHNHTYYSNIRLLDCINSPKDLIDRAIELGLGGIAITDHECLSGHMKINRYAQEIKKTHPDFKIALGNEIYLVDKRQPSQKYYHFILIAKDKIGHKALRELSSIAWTNSFVDRRMERVPITKEELRSIVNKYPNHLIATTACIGGEVSQNALVMEQAKEENDLESASIAYNNIINMINYCKELFGEDFYIECAPGTSEEQKIVNAKLYKIASAFNLKMVVGTDSHYLKKEDRYVHKAYLNSKGGEREVDSFYEFTYLMDSDEVVELLSESFSKEDLSIPNWILDNTLEIQDKIQDYSLEKKQIIPKVKVEVYPKKLRNYFNNIGDSSLVFPIIDSLLTSENEQERYWINECLNSLEKKQLCNEEYLKRIEIEADIIKEIGNKLDDCLFAYFNTFKHYIDLFWECGSIVGPGRGSATGFLSNYLLGITQLDPIKWGLRYWRFLNKERAELPSLLLILGSCKKSM